ncbi:hypothetical protein HN784_04700 [bacterium]|jgi:hypothetical protein|nr:hypothetical protein [bacterium]MBT4251474.1 hypothetical protein [bacterium]MBT4597448.1 hypothetical protein [bacterium]MBT6754287.1 hypothetical protein [bacterium]MBT7037613.1 hypothetical protein [bacterium]
MATKKERKLAIKASNAEAQLLNMHTQKMTTGTGGRSISRNDLQKKERVFRKKEERAEEALRKAKILA